MATFSQDDFDFSTYTELALFIGVPGVLTFHGYFDKCSCCSCEETGAVPGFPRLQDTGSGAKFLSFSSLRKSSASF
jgi:hypothetical protein